MVYCLAVVIKTYRQEYWMNNQVTAFTACFLWEIYTNCWVNHLFTVMRQDLAMSELSRILTRVWLILWPAKAFCFSFWMLSFENKKASFILGVGLFTWRLKPVIVICWLTSLTLFFSRSGSYSFDTFGLCNDSAEFNTVHLHKHNMTSSL